MGPFAVVLISRISNFETNIIFVIKRSFMLLPLQIEVDYKRVLS